MPENSKYIFQYSLPWRHVVTFGVYSKAGDDELALEAAQDVLDSGDLWAPEHRQREDCYLIEDTYYEDDSRGESLDIEPMGELDEGVPWPERGLSVKQDRVNHLALKVVQMMIEAYDRGEENGGSVDWEDLNEVYATALRVNKLAQEAGL